MRPLGVFALLGRCAALSTLSREYSALSTDAAYERFEPLNFSGAVLDAPVHSAGHALALRQRRRPPFGFENTTMRRRLGVDTRAADVEENLASPLYMGIGTHYAHVYVGSPPQRVSVIVDTGSHHTAFPCSGCKSCGHHTDPYFDPSKSTTLKKLGGDCADCVAAARCVSHTCQVSQSYTEGSSWKANQMKDTYYVGGETAKERPFNTKPGTPNEWVATPFVFGCQTYETGLFRTQKADGIMGMSMHAQTLVPTMRAANKLQHNLFSLCFMHGGGTMALGGVDERLHSEPMVFTPLAKNSGWYTVQLLDILLGGKSIGVDPAIFATGKGTIVDSGTTDTYLPRRAADKFMKAWSDHMGKEPKYANTKLSFATSQLAKLPTLTFVFDNDVRVDVAPEAYIESSGGKRIPRVYLTEAAGAVLGANFMQDHDILFDAENRRVGFAKADCSYAALGGTARDAAKPRVLPAALPAAAKKPPVSALAAAADARDGAGGGAAAATGSVSQTASQTAPVNATARQILATLRAVLPSTDDASHARGSVDDASHARSLRDHATTRRDQAEAPSFASRN